MKVEVAHGLLQDFQADTLVVNLFEGVLNPGGATGAVDQALKGAITELVAEGDFSGKTGETAVLYPRGLLPARRVVLVGLGKQASFDLEAVRRASAAALKKARELNARHVASIIHGAGIGGLQMQEAAQATVEGVLLGLYTFAADKKNSNSKNKIEQLSLVTNAAEVIEAAKKGAEAAQTIADGVNLARDLVNMPPNVATPSKMAATAREISAAYGLQLTIGDRDWAAERNMGAYLAVAKGAGEPPYFIVLEHNAGRTDVDTVVLVGKGITFDSGGISIKPSEKMGEMKSDMAGAAAVLAAMKVVGALNLPLHVVGIMPCTENMPDGHAYHPADVIKASNGKTIEIISTDAEGRMILADALVYASQFKPKAVVDLATLTGACVIALGNNVAAGMFCNQEELSERLLKSGQRTYDRLWPLPLWDDYKKVIKSTVADMKNTGGRFGGVGTSAVFLQEFTDYPWAHLDIAGMALSEKADGYLPVGASGFGVRLLVDFLSNW
jgi:leucyl aminopeptidase